MCIELTSDDIVKRAGTTAITTTVGTCQSTKIALKEPSYHPATTKSFASMVICTSPQSYGPQWLKEGSIILKTYRSLGEILLNA